MISNLFLGSERASPIGCGWKSLSIMGREEAPHAGVVFLAVGSTHAGSGVDLLSDPPVFSSSG